MCKSVGDEACCGLRIVCCSVVDRVSLSVRAEWLRDKIYLPVGIGLEDEVVFRTWRHHQSNTE